MRCCTRTLRQLVHSASFVNDNSTFFDDKSMFLDDNSTSVNDNSSSVTDDSSIMSPVSGNDDFSTASLKFASLSQLGFVLLLSLLPTSL